jgi:hypothetical protein
MVAVLVGHVGGVRIGHGYGFCFYLDVFQLLCIKLWNKVQQMKPLEKKEH